MATCDSQQDTIDLTSCSICFEKFKSPRILPCSHSFCHRCLCTYIVSSCDQKDFPLGFPCPLCREFVPSPGQPDEIKRWADKFPINDALIQLMEGQDFNVCWACKRENEDEEATDFCLTCKEPLCKMCSKFHRKNLASMYHEICLVSEIGSRINRSKNVHVCCEKHNDKQIVLFCNDHEQPCCADCFTEEHKSCADILTVQKAAENLKNFGFRKALEQKIKKMTGELKLAKRSREEHLKELNDASERITKEVEQLHQEILSHVNKLFDKHLSNITKNTKEAKRNLEKNTLSISDRIDFLEHLFNLLMSANETLDCDESRLKYISTFHKVKENIAKMLEYPLSEIVFTLKSEILNSFQQLLKISTIGNITVSEIPSPISLSEKIDIKKAEFSLLWKYPDVQVSIRGGTVLPNGNFLCADNKSTHCVLFTEENQTIVQHGTAFDVEPNPWEILLDDGVLYITHRNEEISHIQRFSADDFHPMDPVYVDTCCSGLAVLGDLLFVVSNYCCILKLNKHGKGFTESIYQIQSRGLRYLTDIEDGMLICSNFTDHSVLALDASGNKIWTFKHSELKGPYGLDKDPQNNIYVAGKKSNNIHILSREGSLLRIIKNITNPVGIHFKAFSFTCFVVCQSNSSSQLMLYRFK